MKRSNNYLDAAKKVFTCKDSDLKILTPGNEDLFMDVIFQNRHYRVTSFEGLDNNSRSLLLDEEKSGNIPIEVWYGVGEDLCWDYRFKDALYGMIEENSDRWLLDKIYDRYQEEGGLYLNFWRILYEEDYSNRIYKKAIAATLKIAVFEVMVSELTSGLVENGSEYICEIDGGLFEDVEFEEDGKIFSIFVYSIKGVAA